MVFGALSLVGRSAVGVLYAAWFLLLKQMPLALVGYTRTLFVSEVSHGIATGFHGEAVFSPRRLLENGAHDE